MTVAQLQTINRINKTTPDTFEQLGYIICEVYGLTIDQVNALDGKTIIEYTKEIQKQISAKANKRTVIVPLQTDATKITLGQFIECQQWLKDSDGIQSMHLVAASILLERTDHILDAGVLQNTRFVKIREQVEAFINSMNEMLLKYKGLFEIDPEAEQSEDANEHPFIAQYGWILSATEIAAHERITLDQAFDLPIIQAFNGLAYLKSKAIYEKWRAKK